MNQKPILAFGTYMWSAYFVKREGEGEEKREKKKRKRREEKGGEDLFSSFQAMYHHHGIYYCHQLPRTVDEK
jgi:hypothetical protein